MTQDDGRKMNNYVKVVDGNNRIVGLVVFDDSDPGDVISKAGEIAKRHIDPEAHVVLWKLPDPEALEYERTQVTTPCPPGRHRFLEHEGDTKARVCIRCGQKDVTGVILHAA